jgi:MASE9 protein
MPNLAKAYIAVMAAVAAAVLALVATRWTAANPAHFVLFFALALLASAMKIRLPGFKTNISANFVFILMGLALFSFGETVVLALAGALIQSLWKTRQRPRPVQVLFNAACLTVCTAAAFWFSHRVPAMLGLNSLAAMMALGACVYMVLNTGLVSLVVSLAERRPLQQVWPSCYEWTFPYFLVGSGLAGLASAAGQGPNWGVALLIVPVMYFVYLYYRMRLMRAALENISGMSRQYDAVSIGATPGA